MPDYRVTTEKRKNGSKKTNVVKIYAPSIADAEQDVRSTLEKDETVVRIDRVDMWDEEFTGSTRF